MPRRELEGGQVAEETVIALGDGSLTRKITDRKTKVVPQLSLSFV